MVEGAHRERGRSPAGVAPLDWTSLRDFLAVAEAGSLSHAARRLGVSQPTLTRRMAALEERLRTELFRRTARGVELTEAGESLLEPARQMQLEAHSAELAVLGRDTALAGAVRVTATEGIGIHWLTPTLAEFQAAHPAIEIDVVIQNEPLNLLRREADIALRLGRPRQADLVGRKLGELAFGLYASRAYLERHGRPSSREDLREHRGVAFDEALQDRHPAVWLEPLLSAGSIAYRTNSLLAQIAAMRAGYGIGAAARFIAERYPELERVLFDEETWLDIWLVTHAGLRRSARIRAVFDFLAERLAAAGDLFAGRLAAAREPAA
jgi:DNA-binding transcriptional LysR family regulator